MNTKTGLAALTALVALALAPIPQTFGAESGDQAQEVKDLSLIHI